MREESAFEEAVLMLLENRTVCWTDADGKLHPIPTEHLANDFRANSFNNALLHYEDKAHPYQQKPTLRKRWSDLIQETWKELVYYKVVPYLPPKRRKK